MPQVPQHDLDYVSTKGRKEHLSRNQHSCQRGWGWHRTEMARSLGVRGGCSSAKDIS